MRQKEMFDTWIDAVEDVVLKETLREAVIIDPVILEDGGEGVVLLGLGLAGSVIGSEGVMQVARALESDLALTKLHIFRCGIGAEGVARLARVLETNTTLREWGLWENGIGAEGVASVVQALETNTTLSKLYLDTVAGQIELREGRVGLQGTGH